VAYNINDMLRANLGFGSFPKQNESITSLGGGLKAMLPSANFSPVIGLNFAHTDKGGDVKGAGSHLYVNVGLDYQAPGGLYLGVGINESLSQATPILPYLNVGYFFAK